MAYAIGFILLLLRGQGSMFNGGYFPASSMAEDASGNFFTIHETGGHDDYVFGTQNGFFAVDTEGGTILSGPKAASKDFDSTTAGTYRALFYTKSNAQMGQNNVESGTASEENGTVTIGANGSVVITDSQGNTIASGTVAAIADTTYIDDGTANSMSDPSYMMSTFRTMDTSEQDVFVTFQGNTVIFSSFKTGLPVVQNGTYEYFYGVGLK